MARGLAFQLLATTLLCFPSSTIFAAATCDTSTSSDCSNQALGLEAVFAFSSLDSNVWNTTGNGSTGTSSDDGLSLSIDQSGDTPTVESYFYIYGGRLEIWAKAPGGSGIFSYMGLQADDSVGLLWALSGDSNVVFTEYWASSFDIAEKTNSTVSTDYTNFHNYTITWSETEAHWFIDGNNVHTTSSDSLSSYPWEPMHLSFFVWGGPYPEPDFSDAPFTLSILNVTVTDSQSGIQSYDYNDSSGTVSVTTTEGTSNVAQDIINDGEAVSVSSTSSSSTTKSTGTSTASTSHSTTKASSGSTATSVGADSGSGTPSTTSNASTSSSTSSSSSSGGLSAGAKAGIGVAVAVAAVGLLFLISFILFRRHKKRVAAGTTSYGDNSPEVVQAPSGLDPTNLGFIAVQQPNQPNQTDYFIVRQQANGSLILERQNASQVPSSRGSLPQTAATLRGGQTAVSGLSGELENQIYILKKTPSGTMILEKPGPAYTVSELDTERRRVELSGRPVYMADNLSELPA